MNTTAPNTVAAPVPSDSARQIPTPDSAPPVAQDAPFDAPPSPSTPADGAEAQQTSTPAIETRDVNTPAISPRLDIPEG